MYSPLTGLRGLGTKVWLDSVDPDEVARNRAWGATGATSNPSIVAELIHSCRYDRKIREFLAEGSADEELLWRLTDMLVSYAEQVFLPVWEETRGDDGYVSFELDPLLELPENRMSLADRSLRYLELGKRWRRGHHNRMIKVPNTDAGVAAMEDLAAAGVPINVTLTFTEQQYVRARDAIWRGARQLPNLDNFKSVYSIFVSRVDIYADKYARNLSPPAQGQVGIYNAKKIWRMNEEFWADKGLRLKQEIVFASTGVKRPGDSPLKYVDAFSGAGIQTNPPATNAAIQSNSRRFVRRIEEMPPLEVIREIERKIDPSHLETVLMSEGIQKFAEPHLSLLQLLAEKQATLSASVAS